MKLQELLRGKRWEAFLFHKIVTIHMYVLFLWTVSGEFLLLLRWKYGKPTNL